MKILYIMSFYPNNPRNIKLIKNLQKEYEVRCCFLASKNQEILKQNQNDFVFKSQNISNKFSKMMALFYFYRYIKKVIIDYNPDIIFAYHWETFVITRLATIFNKKTKIIYDISDIPSYSGNIHKILKKIEEFFINSKIFLLYASPYFVKKYKRFSKNTFFVLNNKPEKEFLEKYLANKKNNTILLASFYGVFRDSEIFKNIFEALKGLPILFRMKGSGFQKKIIEDISKQYKNVEVGDEFYYKDLPILYGDVDIIVSLYSNKDENTNLALGNKFFEAMALKKIALFPEKTKMGELAKKNSFGLVVNPYNIQDIRKAFLEILENSENVKNIRKKLSQIKEKEIFYEYEVKEFLPILKNFLKND
ncbi:glycosyltransferase [Fusobacterium nucleatum]|uniref:glycosyltransferase n=1 Tax=Fusobacterium nucleatum TaxID=851 RepID=UPI0030CD7C25